MAQFIIFIFNMKNMILSKFDRLKDTNILRLYISVT